VCCAAVCCSKSQHSMRARRTQKVKARERAYACVQGRERERKKRHNEKGGEQNFHSHANAKKQGPLSHMRTLFTLTPHTHTHTHTHACIHTHTHEHTSIQARKHIITQACTQFLPPRRLAPSYHMYYIYVCIYIHRHVHSSSHLVASRREIGPKLS